MSTIKTHELACKCDSCMVLQDVLQLNEERVLMETELNKLQENLNRLSEEIETKSEMYFKLIKGTT
jgi:seryl-tRNA synthetase